MITAVKAVSVQHQLKVMIVILFRFGRAGCLAVEAVLVKKGDPLPKVDNFLIDVVLNYTDEQYMHTNVDLIMCKQGHYFLSNSRIV